MSPDILLSVSVHPTEELLEEYSFGRLSEPALGVIEEHLLICSHCQSALLAIDEYTALMKAGITAFERERQIPLASPPPPRWFALPKIPGTSAVLVAAILLVLLGATNAWRLHPSSFAASQPETVKLMALRGGDEGGAHAHSGRPLDLVLDRGDLPASAAYRLEVVSTSGRLTWSGVAQITDRMISAHVTTLFSRGAYWVRLYSSGDQLRREFGLRVE